MATGIQWTDETWNPVTGCAKVSPGCAHCYAEDVADRLWPTQYPPVEYVTCSEAAGCSHPDDADCNPVTESRPRVFTDVLCHEDRLDQPLRWKTPRRIFVNSMSDLFHEDVPDAFIDRVFAVMALAPQHTFQVLTKRAERMRDYFTRQDRHGFSRKSNINGAIWSQLGTTRGSKIKHGGNWQTELPVPNVWLGVSVENQQFADERIPLLLQTPAAVRFISAEPLLGPVDLHGARYETAPGRFQGAVSSWKPALDWVIVGGESGTAARPFGIAWARSIIAQCRATGVACFVKQVGRRPFVADPETDWGVGAPDGTFGIRDSHGGDWDEWPADLRVREFPNGAAPVR